MDGDFLTTILIALVGLLAFGVYFLPTYFAFLRSLNMGLIGILFFLLIFVLNTFLGWTLVGWVFVLLVSIGDGDG